MRQQDEAGAGLYQNPVRKLLTGDQLTARCRAPAGHLKPAIAVLTFSRNAARWEAVATFMW